ncbi:MAG: 5'-nucleotidase C-terminal domain-containing protein [Bacilli bacterium]|nr:5'-nucleotidase C-terminal domain-containing protein [Bacilli bacterium]
MGRYKKLTILHSNDMHGDFFSEERGQETLGGASRLSGYVSKVRSEEKNVLYAIAGDMFRGNIIDSEYQGISTIEVMNMISPDVVTIGNHETDYGLAHLLFLEKCAKFPIINANLFIKSNHARLFQPFKIIEIDGMKILFIGIVTEEVLANTKNEGLIGTFVDISEAAEEVGHICNTYNAIDIDYTVLLTHIGWEEDKKLAELLDPAWGVDVIIGGHSHTFIEEPAVVNDILIVQAGTGTDQIGRFDIEIDTEKNCTHKWEWNCIQINEKTCPRDEKLEEVIDSYKNMTDQKYGRVITRFKRELTHPDRYRETDLGDLFADILKESLGLDVMLLGSGSIRKTALGPIVNLQDLMEVFPYDDSIHMVTVTGKQLKEMLLYMLRDEAFEGDHTEFYQLSDGLHVLYNRSTHKMEEFTLNEKEIKPDDMIKLGLQKYHFLNLDIGFNKKVEELESTEKSRIIATSCRDVLEEYMSTHQHLDRKNEGRLVIKK